MDAAVLHQDDGVGQRSGDAGIAQQRRGGGGLQRGEAEARAGVTRDDELDEAVAEIADAVE